MGGEIDRVHVGESTALFAAPHGAADGRHDHDVLHISSSAVFRFSACARSALVSLSYPPAAGTPRVPNRECRARRRSAAVPRRPSTPRPTAPGGPSPPVTT